MFIFLLLLVAIGFAAYWFFRRRGGGSLFESERKQEPLEIARRRYASGEISRQEFEQIKQDLKDKEK